MLFLTNKKEMYEYAIRYSTGVVKTLRSFIKERHTLKIILIIINEYRRYILGGTVGCVSIAR